MQKGKTEFVFCVSHGRAIGSYVSGDGDVLLENVCPSSHFTKDANTKNSKLSSHTQPSRKQLFIRTAVNAVQRTVVPVNAVSN